MRAKHAALIRKGIIEARRDAQIAVAVDPTYALFAAEPRVTAVVGLPLKLRLTMSAYQRTFSKATRAAALAPAVTQLIDDIYKTLHREDA